MHQSDIGKAASRFKHVIVEYEPEYRAVWAKIRYPQRPCISIDLLDELRQVQQEIVTLAKQNVGKEGSVGLAYQILTSTHPGIFNLGGDLDFFIQSIRSGNRDGLTDYARACIEILYATATGYGLPFTSIALVQGETLGGGFEAALSANVLIAERSAKFGFPETVFGMFPGMGAYSFLARCVAPALAKRIITSGKVYSADELYNLGVVDLVVPDGRGVSAVHDFIRHQRLRTGGFLGLDRVMREYNPLTYKELEDSVAVWVETALKLSDKNLRLMEYLLNAQNKRMTVDRARVAINPRSDLMG